MKLKVLAAQSQAPGKIQTVVWERSVNVLLDVSVKTISSDVPSEAQI